MQTGDSVNTSDMEPADSLHFGVTGDGRTVTVVLTKDGEPWYVELPIEEFRQGVRMVFSSLGN